MTFKEQLETCLFGILFGLAPALGIDHLLKTNGSLWCLGITLIPAYFFYVWHKNLWVGMYEIA